MTIGHGLDADRVGILQLWRWINRGCWTTLGWISKPPWFGFRVDSERENWHRWHVAVTRAGRATEDDFNMAITHEACGKAMCTGDGAE